jgi:hydroxymethylbilane synthase
MIEKEKLIIGSRGSKLSLAYAEHVKNLLLKSDATRFVKLVEIKIIKTSGDIFQNKKISEIGGKGVFCKQIEEQLLDSKIDIAVHSLKDLPTKMTDGLCVNAVVKRNDPRDAFLSHTSKSFHKLKPKSIIGTSSFRRQAQLNLLRKDIKIVPMRGNIDTRIDKLKNKEFDAIVLSLAGVQMLNLKNEVKEIFSIKQMLPAIGQGAIAMQCKIDDKETLNILRAINHQETYRCIQAERALLDAIGGDCDTAIGGLANLSNETITLTSELFSNDGKKKFEAHSTGHFKEAKEIGFKVGNELLKKAGPDFTTQGN